MQDTQTRPTEEAQETSPCYEVYADGRRIYHGNDFVDAALACHDAGRVHGAMIVEYFVDGHRFARLVCSK